MAPDGTHPGSAGSRVARAGVDAAAGDDPQRATPQGNLQFALNCGSGAHGTSQEICRELFRTAGGARSRLVQSDNSCVGGVTDQSRITGTVAGIAIDRSFSDCYGGVTAAWEKLLGVQR